MNAEYELIWEPVPVGCTIVLMNNNEYGEVTGAVIDDVRKKYLLCVQFKNRKEYVNNYDCLLHDFQINHYKMDDFITFDKCKHIYHTIPQMDGHDGNVNNSNGTKLLQLIDKPMINQLAIEEIAKNIDDNNTSDDENSNEDSDIDIAKSSMTGRKKKFTNGIAIEASDSQ